MAPASCRLCHSKRADDARRLSCNHDFCLPCLRSWHAAPNHGTDAVILCPFCRHSCPLPPHGLDQLPSSPETTEDDVASDVQVTDLNSNVFKVSVGKEETGSEGHTSRDRLMKGFRAGSEAGCETTSGRRRRLTSSSSRNSSTSCVSEDEEELPVFDWNAQLRRDQIICSQESSALAERPKPRLLWRLGKHHIDGPYDVTFLPDGRLAVAEYWARRVQIFSEKGTPDEILVNNLEPQALCVGRDDNLLAITDTLHQRVVMVTGDRHTTWLPKGLELPNGITCTKSGKWVVTDTETHSVAIYSPSLRLLRHFGGYGEENANFDNPLYVTSDAHGRIIVSDCENHSVKVFDPEGEKLLMKLGGHRSTGDGRFVFPHGVCTDRACNIMVADYGNARVSTFSPDGAFLSHTLTSEDGIRGPRGLAQRDEGSRSALMAVTCGWMNKMWLHRIVEY